ncbi:MAG: hypothetical protein ACSHX6_10465 [Akkermansiaceae bacterium]
MEKLIIIVFGVLFMIFPTVAAQDPMVKARLEAISNQFKKLPLKKREEFIVLKRRATKENKEQRYFSCIVTIDKALHIFSEDMDLIWLKGICLARIHDVDGATEQYLKVLGINISHMLALMNLVEIHFFSGDFEEASKYVNCINWLRRGESLPLLDFKHLVCLSKLSIKQPDKYKNEIKRLSSLHSSMDDTPYFYYVNALREFESGNRLEGEVWLSRAATVFADARFIDVWNKVLLDSHVVAGYEIELMRVDIQEGLNYRVWLGGVEVLK